MKLALPKYYVARDKQGIVWLFTDKPIKVEEAGAWYSKHFRLLLPGTLSSPEHRGKLEPHWEDEEPLEVAVCLYPYDEVPADEITRVDILRR